MNKDLPAITGPELIRLLQENGWQTGRKATHGRALKNGLKLKIEHL